MAPKVGIPTKRPICAEFPRLTRALLNGLRKTSENGGECGIRTHGRLPYTRFPSVRLRPLGQLSGFVRFFLLSSFGYPWWRSWRPERSGPDGETDLRISRLSDWRYPGRAPESSQQLIQMNFLGVLDRELMRSGRDLGARDPPEASLMARTCIERITAMQGRSPPPLDEASSLALNPREVDRRLRFARIPK